MMYYFFILFACGKSNTDSADTAAAEDGSCSYDDFAGICTYEGSGYVTFAGTINGENVSYPENDLGLGTDQEEPEVGAEIPCVISYITKGTCTPCLLDIGNCGSEAFSGLPQ